MKIMVDGIEREATAAEQAEIDARAVAWAAGAASRNALAEIARLEALVTPRRLRDAVLGDVLALAFIQDIESQISVQRALVA